VNTPANAAFAVAELEGPGDYEGIMRAIETDALPSCALAVCTNFNVPLVDAQGVPQPAAAKPLIDARFRCLTEAYIGDNPNATPPRLDFTGRKLGWATTQPVFGIYNKPLSAYDEWKSGGWSIYLAEYAL
jgi:hypothetical protein